VVVLDPAVSARREWSDAGRLFRLGLAWTLYALGWAAAKGLRAAGTAVVAVLFGAGWLAARVVWPALCWAGRAVALGWDEGRKPGFKG
jgi:hypothetical protein